MSTTEKLSFNVKEFALTDEVYTQLLLNCTGCNDEF